ncbi:hypothetical protein Y1Q_0002536 [Alligator mississippiensis]|uniref:Uncharacterized protein n=1 Tax=Alligator mississippiensis TaxID=8496 RepID=A0A151NBD3_ALLMI|nr:hypothetical protein Y1Q_0002536 [Alligator mississippiensis]
MGEKIGADFQNGGDLCVPRRSKPRAPGIHLLAPPGGTTDTSQGQEEHMDFRKTGPEEPRASTPAAFSQDVGMINKSAPTDLRVWGCLQGTSNSFRRSYIDVLI